MMNLLVLAAVGKFYAFYDRGVPVMHYEILTAALG